MYKLVFLLVAILSVQPTQGNADSSIECDSSFFGPEGDLASRFYYSSTCIELNDINKPWYRVRNEVCSSTDRTVAFYWRELNWKSGAAGTGGRKCLEINQSATTYGVLQNTQLETTEGTVADHAFVSVVPLHIPAHHER